LFLSNPALKGAELSKYSLRVPEVPAGTVGQVTSEPGTGTEGFSLNANNYLLYHGNVEGNHNISACPCPGY
jgi:hypothetical protein